MSAPIQLIRLAPRRSRTSALRMAARVGMFALCLAVFCTVFGWVYLQLPR